MSRKSKTDLLVRQRFQNPLPPPSFPPKLLTIKTDPSRYATYDFLTPLSMEREVPMIVDSEGGMHLDQNLVPGYWESEKEGRDGRMVPDLSTMSSEMDDEDLELLVDPPGANPTAAGIMPSTSGANMDLVGSGRMGSQNSKTATRALDRRKHDVAWIRRTDYAVASEASQAAKRDAVAREMAIAQQAKPAVQTVDQQIQTIIETFSAMDLPLADVKHPTKSHLQAVESFDILPDEQIWGNQYALFKFADDPLENKAGQPHIEPTASSSNIGLLRPLEHEGDESGSNRVAYFRPDDGEVAEAYYKARQASRNTDEQLMDPNADAIDLMDPEVAYGFRFMRDYDTTRRDVTKEFVFVIEEDGSAPKAEESAVFASRQRSKGAYYVPLVSYTLLRKRRARKGEAANDYSDLGIEFWEGLMLQTGGVDLYPEDEADARRQELGQLRAPGSIEQDMQAESEATAPQANGSSVAVNGNGVE